MPGAAIGFLRQEGIGKYDRQTPVDEASPGKIVALRNLPFCRIVLPPAEPGNPDAA